MGLAKHAMMTSPTGRGVIVMGGLTKKYNLSKAIFELSKSMQWTRWKQSLQIGHYSHLAIPIQDELIYEKIKEKRNHDLAKKVKTKKKSNKKESDKINTSAPKNTAKSFTHDDIEEWVRKKNVAKNMKKVELVIYL